MPLLAQVPRMEPTSLLAIIIVIFFGLGLHEYAHAKLADMAGDPTPRYFGRVTLNLFKHFDPIGTIMIIITALVGVGIGWGKPVPMDPSKMQNPRWDHFVAVFGGPLLNFLQAIVWAFVWRLGVAGTLGQAFDPGGVMQGSYGFLPCLVFYGIIINLSLCFFNLLPIGPLDGMWIVGTFLPEKARFKWTRWNLSVGQFVFLGLVILGQVSDLHLLSSFIGPPLLFFLRLLI